ncbi:efflux RND transporter periplasmic adaptor subunit [Candidatus Bandiella euplotis]|uniref:HlyD family efflux RND transporter periplasmic adaptor secretion protein n=1 Tax=Candidatus Bandiella euplotis TaxID=1664265 RepID=A0ABZ0UNM2_9RICK|nr:efflux RND transporter periplasmic adaptor subunit [Candidatus Bandiella woodruffii]WPX96569.1 HlyD family efflux RND transporter periplasmic adaptor secretion protein [Candidatus Bandiella woodruffii]
MNFYMLLQLSHKFKKLSAKLRIVIIFLIVLTIWMLSAVFKGKEAPNVINQPNLNYKVSKSVAVNKDKTLSFTGITKAEEHVILTSELNGKVVSILAKNGSFLKRGSEIVQLDQKNYLQSYNAAKEDLANKEILYQSALKLKQQGLGSNASLADSKAKLYDAKANMKQAKINLDNSIIKAPYDGVIDEINAKVGGYLTAGSPVGKFLSNKIIKIKFSVPNSQFDDVKRSTGVSLVIDGKEVNIKKLSSLSCSANDVTKTYAAEVLTDNTELGLKSGQIVRVVVNAGSFLAHKVNQSTINIDVSGNVGVKILNKEKVVEFVPVEIIGEDSDGFWVINLPESVKIITLGHQYLQAGEKLVHMNKDGKDL